MTSEPFPDSVRRLFWDVDPADIDLIRHRDYVLERVMTRGSWEAMRWLRASYRREEIADFLARKADRLSPRDRAYWSLIANVRIPQVPGGGRPAWAG